VVALWVACLLCRGPAAHHPLHTTLTELTYRAADRTVQVSVRAFADDFDAAAGGVSDSAASAYLRSVLTLTDRNGRPLPLAWCGLRRTGDLLWLCLSGAAPGGGLGGLRVAVRLLFERYRDQINIVQVSDGEGGRRTSMLFVRGDAEKPLS
jgi:uncharacterized protein DUF6702